MKYVLSSCEIGGGLYILLSLILFITNRCIEGIPAKLLVLFSIQFMVFSIENGIADFIKERSKEE